MNWKIRRKKLSRGKKRETGEEEEDEKEEEEEEEEEEEDRTKGGMAPVLPLYTGGLPLIRSDLSLVSSPILSAALHFFCLSFFSL